MRVLGRNTLILRCFCQSGFVKNLVDLLEPSEESEESDKAKEITLNALKLLKLLAAVGGAGCMELSMEDMLNRLMRIVLQELTEDATQVDATGSQLQETALELVARLIKDSIHASQQVIYCINPSCKETENTAAPPMSV